MCIRGLFALVKNAFITDMCLFHKQREIQPLVTQGWPPTWECVADVTHQGNRFIPAG